MNTTFPEDFLQQFPAFRGELTQGDRAAGEQWLLVWQAAQKAARTACATLLTNAADSLAPEGKRTNQVDRHVAEVLRGKADEILCADYRTYEEALGCFAKKVAAAEREACAVAVEAEALECPADTADDAAYNNAIRHAAAAVRNRAS